MIEGKPEKKKRRRKRDREPDWIAVAIREHMREHRITVSELSRTTGINRPRLSLWFNGKRNIRATEIARVLEALELRGVIEGGIAARWTRTLGGRSEE